MPTNGNSNKVTPGYAAIKTVLQYAHKVYQTSRYTCQQIQKRQPDMV